MDALPNAGEFLVWFVVFLFTLTVHEACHGLVAWVGGDSTAYHGGQVTLNPWPHVRREPVGTLVVPLLTFFTSGFMMGWASTPFDPEWGRRHPKRLAAMSAAGPGGQPLDRHRRLRRPEDAPRNRHRGAADQGQIQPPRRAGRRDAGRIGAVPPRFPAVGGAQPERAALPVQPPAAPPARRQRHRAGPDAGRVRGIH